VKPLAGTALDLTGRTALVTGGARGIGLVTAGLLSESGARVVIVDSNADRIEPALAQLRSQDGEVDGWPCDVTDETQVVASVRRATERFAEVDLLVNNAGYAHHCPPEEMDLVEWERVLAVCLTGTFLASKAVARALMAAGRPGTIVNLSSIAGTTSLGRGSFAYGAAKAGIEQLTRELAVEWATQRIRVNAVAPCQVRTEGFASVAEKQSTAGDRFLDRVLRGIPAGRLAEPIEVAHAIHFLSSDSASMITGVVLPVDGGNLAMNPGATLRG